MKHVYFVRHAKSSWSHPDLSDFERPLNARGREDASRVARHLYDIKGSPSMDGILTSSAQRALQTAHSFRKIWGVDMNCFHPTSELYHASSQKIISSLWALPEDYTGIGLFAHNPGMTHLANIFKGEMIDNVPTCGVFYVQFDVTQWTDIALDGSNGLRQFVLTPKSIS